MNRLQVAMSKSVLSGRIGVCKSISKLNTDGCIDVLRLLKNVMGSDALNQFTTKTFMDCSKKWTIDQITKFENEIKPTFTNQNYCHSHSESHQSRSRRIRNKKNMQFPLLRLPIDLITQTSFYLNEADIFEFEKCCRLFYQMINNTSYLNLSNNFKTCRIDLKRVNQIPRTRSRYGFFKYSKAKKMELFVNIDLENKNEPTYTKSKWDKAMIVAQNDGWFDNIFKSIELLIINWDPMSLLDKLPIELLFDPNESHLNRIEFCHDTDLKQYIDKFETRYLEMKEKLAKHGKQMRKLKVVVHHNFFYSEVEGPFYILAEHLVLVETRIDLNKNCNWLSQDYNPCLRKLTWDNIQFDNINININDKQRNDLNKRKNINIETLRLNYSAECSYSHNILNNVAIESLNLQNSLKNLMLYIEHDHDSLTQWQNAIESIIKKEDFYKLENVIILLRTENDNITWILEMLTKNVQLLKYQFKKFIIGWNIEDVHCHVLEWNKEIDKKYLHQLKEKLKSTSWYNQDIQKQMEQKYSEWNEKMDVVRYN